MPFKQINPNAYPGLFAEYKNVPNFKAILEVIVDQCDHLFDLDKLEIAIRTNQRLNYFTLFDQCVKQIPNDWYTKQEILPKIAQYLFQNQNCFMQPFYVADDLNPTDHLGFYEKFITGGLEAKLDDAKTLKQFAFTTPDMVRTAASPRAKWHPGEVRVAELRHLDYIAQNDALKTTPFYGQTCSSKPALFIRSTSGDARGLSQWIFLYYMGANAYIYSESPIEEEDKKILLNFLSKGGFEEKNVVHEGGKAGLSMASGMRAISKCNELKGGAGLSVEADYFSLLVEWVWFVGSVGTGMLKAIKKPSEFNWFYFRQHTLQELRTGAPGRQTFQHVLLNFKQNIGVPIENDHYQMRSYHLALDWLLADPDVGYLKTDSVNGRVSLDVPKDIRLYNSEIICDQTKSLNQLFVKHGEKARYQFSVKYIAQDSDNSEKTAQSVAICFVLNVFRACAKQKTLSINLPVKYQLQPRDIALVCYLMQINPFVCDFINPTENASLNTIHEQIKHIFARNRWLSINGYLPPILDDFWDVAASFWVSFLKLNPNLTSGLEHREFKRCANEMGIHGLRAVFNYLTREEQTLKPEFNKLLKNQETMPTFYAGCPARDIKIYTEVLLKYLENHAYFPFGKFEFSFTPGVNQDIVHLFTSLNRLETFERISLSNCIAEEHLEEFSHLIDLILQRMQQDSTWTCPIRIPELELPAENDKIQGIRRKYLQMNNVLVSRMRVKHNRELEKCTSFMAVIQSDPSMIPEELAPNEEQEAPAKSAQEKHNLIKVFNDACGNLKKALPLERSGGIALQMQQQQQMKQDRTRCLDHEMEKGSAFKDILPTQLITYENIDEILEAYYTKLKADEGIDEDKATLNRDGATPLQNFFHTWINANPIVSAEHIIAKMTPEAARMLLKHHRHLSGGLNVYNLPKGFYTQRSASGHLVLGYKLTLAFTTDNNPLTLKLNQDQASAETFLGDFRQFEPTKYVDNTLDNWDELDYTYAKLFSQLQPLSDKNKEQKYVAFMAKGGEYHTIKEALSAPEKNLLTAQKDLVIENWVLFYTLFTMQGANGVKQFLIMHKSKSLRLTDAEVQEHLLSRVAPDLQTWANNALLNDQEFSKAMAQVYFSNGDYGLTRFLIMLSTIEQRLGDSFLQGFMEKYLSACETFNPLMQETSMNTVDEMINVLSHEPIAKGLWHVYLERQMQAVDWEDITVLWKGFYFFYQNIKGMELQAILTPKLLKGVKPRSQNMLVCFDRLLLALEKIPNTDQRKAFINRLPELDLTEGGAPYAVRHESYAIIDPSLKLADFEMGSPTYAVDMRELFHWDGTTGELYLKRALASRGHFKYEDYQVLNAAIKDTTLQSKYQLLWALHTGWAEAKELLNALSNTFSADVMTSVAKHFHHVFYIKNNPYVQFPLRIFEVLTGNPAILHIALNKYPDHVILFECLKLLENYKKLDNEALHRVGQLIAVAPVTHHHLQQGLCLATVFGVSTTALNQFYDQTTSLKAITRQELVILIQQLLSLDLTHTPSTLLKDPTLWTMILDGIHAMDANPMAQDEHRKRLLIRLKKKGLKFKSSLSGDYRMVVENDLLPLGLDQIFEQHSARLAGLFKSHIAISESQKDEGSLLPLVEFFKRLQLNKTYINEIEPLLAMIEKVLENSNGCWTATYFNKLLRSLQAKEGNAGFPIGFLEALLTEPRSPFLPTPIDDIVAKFPEQWCGVFDAILAKGGMFTRPEQAQLGRIGVRAFNLSGNHEFVPDLIQKLSNNKFQDLRGVILSCLTLDNPERFTSNLSWCEALVDSGQCEEVANDWTSTCQLWIETLTRHPELKKPFLTDRLDGISDAKKKALMLHIVAWSCFPSNQYPTAPRKDYLKKGVGSKAIKLVERLQALSNDELVRIAQCYPKQPAPDAKHLLTFIKASQQTPKESILDALDAFLISPFDDRRDYKTLTVTREDDLRRMLQETRVTRGNENNYLTSTDEFKLTFLFQYLKELENGNALIDGATRPICEMSQHELAQAFRECSGKHPATDITKTQVWAILFETLGRTTGKYPHLAQQFALIANDLLLANDPSSILQLKTGEGKSHFVAMRAARHVGTGLKVDVCTAKWSLAERDLLDYKGFFDYLEIQTANIQARSAPEDYHSAQIVYTTPGDLSLFLDEQANQGVPITINRENRVGLGDEFDFLYYEGQKTQFNYARHTGITPKEMAWFYRGLIGFYHQKIHPNLIPGKSFSVTGDMLAECFIELVEKANEDGRLFLDNFKSNPILLFGWLQSTHEAATLERDKHYTVRLEQVSIGSEVFPLQEVYPLTKDQQAAVGSTFSHGVHQLLAERLNMDAKKDGKPQNYHVHPESDIVSSQVFSQRLKTLWHRWEGFTGTVSSAQALELHNNHRTAVLRVPTNQKDLRSWPKPQFFKGNAEQSQEARLKAIVHDIKQKIAERKSILWCCATDADVKAMTADIQKYFTPEEYAKHFMSYTNESHFTAAEVLRQKKQKEGDFLGQKQRGVVLIAAGFGRGDNVDVETVILGSVSDVNDKFQKGGRTARNGEEGEVRQYYLQDEVSQELLGLAEIIDSAPVQLKNDILTELQAKNHPLAQVISANKDYRKEILEGIDLQVQFDILLQLREFLCATDNQTTMIYHEAKARLSSEAIKRIGLQDDPAEREHCVRAFAYFLQAMEKQWIEIQAANTDPGFRIQRLYEFVEDKCADDLQKLFKEPAEFPFHRDEPVPFKFVLDTPPVKESDELEQWRSRILNQCLGVTNFPADQDAWDEVIQGIISIQGADQLQALLYQFATHSPVEFADLRDWVSEIKQDKDALHTAKAVKKHNELNLFDVYQALLHDKDKAVQALGKEVHVLLVKLNTKTSNRVANYLRKPGLSTLPEHVAQAFPLLKYIAGDGFSKVGDLRDTYFQHPAQQDQLLTVPATCLEGCIGVSANMLITINRFIGKVMSKDNPQYPVVFKQLAKGLVHQTEKRLRLLGEVQSLLKYAKAGSQILVHLADLMETLEKPEHFVFLDTLIGKLRQEYVSIAKIKNDALREQKYVRVESFVHTLVNSKQKMLALLPLLNHLLKREGQEYMSCMEDVLSHLHPQFGEISQEFWKYYWPSDVTTSKKDKIKKYKETIILVQKWYETNLEQFKKNPQRLKTIFSEAFQKYLLSDYFSNSNEQVSQLDSIMSLLDRIQLACPNLDEKVIHAQLATLSATPLKMEKLLMFSNLFDEYTAEILFNHTLDVLVGPDADMAETIVIDFYTQRLSGSSVGMELSDFAAFNDFSKWSAERVKWMTLIKQGAFIPTQLVTNAWTEEKNKALFDSGLEVYVKQTQAIVKADSSWSFFQKPRGLKSDQQTAIFKIIDELKQIGKAVISDDEFTPKLPEGLVAEMQVQLKKYEDKKGRNTARNQQLANLKTKIAGLSTNQGCISLLREILAVKKEVMLADAQVVSQQWFPRLHFWGHSRLYRTLNNIEDVILEKFVVSVPQNNGMLNEYEGYEDFHKQSRSEYVGAFKEALKKWDETKHFGLFQSSAKKLMPLIHEKSDAEIIAILKKNSSLVKYLPGTLKAIANEVLAHSVSLPSEAPTVKVPI